MAEITDDALAEIINKGFHAQGEALNSQIKSLALEMPTRKDVRDIVEESTELLTKSIDTVSTNLDQFKKETADNFQEVRSDIAKIDTRTEEDTTATMSDHARTQKTVAELVRVVEKLSGEKIIVQ